MGMELRGWRCRRRGGRCPQRPSDLGVQKAGLLGFRAPGTEVPVRLGTLFA